ncbi:MAG: FAD:protein FMN transferase [Fidelibacterota bacterium]|nr:MAG: FAD:protein FMN transferase [Candidatus Neomarinimicrobiota bacterium]
MAASLAAVEVRRLEEEFNPMNTAGSLNRLNEARELSDPEFYQVLEHAWQVSELTGGGLNIFLGYLERAYGFERLFPQPPEAGAVQEMILALQRASLQFVPESNQVRIPNDAFAVSLTGVQEGYVADQVLAHLAYSGVSGAKVEVGRHVACGDSPDGLGWPIEVDNPQSGEVIVRLYLEHCGVATASVRDQAYSYRDETYYNHLDPATGRPARALSLVTVVAPSCELAGGLAQGIFVMEPEAGLSLLNALPEVDGMLVDPEGRIAMSDSLFIWIGE